MMHARTVVTESGESVSVAFLILGDREQTVIERAAERLKQIIDEVVKEHPSVKPAEHEYAVAMEHGYWWADLGSDVFTVKIAEPESVERVDSDEVEITVEGGLIDVNAPESIDVVVTDYDADGVDEKELATDSEGRPCLITTWKGGAS